MHATTTKVPARLGRRQRLAVVENRRLAAIFVGNPEDYQTRQLAGLLLGAGHLLDACKEARAYLASRPQRSRCQQGLIDKIDLAIAATSLDDPSHRPIPRKERERIVARLRLIA